ncbi:MAG: hypothetical protein ACJ74B_05010 [Gaiellaceae bacterium]
MATTLEPVTGRVASNTACVFSIGGDVVDDPKPANDCVTKTLRIVGKR